jgi:hypothetical protein
MDAESESLSAVMQSKLIDQVRRIARTLHVAKRTEEAYVGCLHVSDPLPKSTWKMSPI